ncbi:MAG TPA: hypothetical protein VMD59_23340 [Acidimicrobiales bacterium]|nr:hypothetical protein [Acidimicrobiales bacterium]
MSHPALEPSGEVVVITTNPDEDCSPAAFRELLDALAAAPEPELDSIGAGEAVRELRLES